MDALGVELGGEFACFFVAYATARACAPAKDRAASEALAIKDQVVASFAERFGKAKERENVECANPPAKGFAREENCV